MPTTPEANIFLHVQLSVEERRLLRMLGAEHNLTANMFAKKLCLDAIRERFGDEAITDKTPAEIHS
jgi:hypothetical protein